MNKINWQKANVRFHIFLNGSFVKLTLKDKPIVLDTTRDTDEGYENRYTKFVKLEDGTVIKTWEINGQDCDGRYSKTGREWSVPRTDGYLDEGHLCLSFHEAEYSQRDYSAEAMGY